MARFIARILLGLALCVAVIAVGTTAQARAYENFNYGFEVMLPPGMRLFITEPPGPNHGFTLLNKSSDCDADDQEGIEFFAAYNAGDDASSAVELSKIYCANGSSNPTKYNVGGLKFRKCSVIGRFGKLIDVKFVALRPRPGEDISNWIICMIDIVCKNENYAKWHRVLEKIFVGMKLAKVEQ
ncbi:MAG: hypothetical protein P4M00_09570 [Azospirillaceae bacterium]|nr:hypothetical protein [Azospirillaceae bacterium]